MSLLLLFGGSSGSAIGAGAAAGTGAAVATGTETAAGAGAAAGTGTAAGTGRQTAAGAGAAAAVGSAAGTGRALVAGAGAAPGVGSAAGVGRILAIGVGTAAATSSAGAVGQLGAAIGAATGSGAAAGTGRLTAQATGAAAGLSQAAGTGTALVRGAGTAAGSSIVVGHGIEATFAVGVGAAFASSSGAGVGKRAAVGTGIAFGVSGAAAIGELFQFPPPLQYPFRVPREFCPRALTIAARNTSMINESPTTGQQLVGATAFERWEWEVELPVMEAHEGEPVAAFLESLRGMRGAFEFGNPKKSRARGSARQGDNPIVEGSTSREIYINATSILGNRKRWLAAGDMISIGQSGSITRRLYRVLRDVDLAFGHGVANVWPALRIVPLIPGDTVYVENASTIFRLAHQSIEHEVDVEGWYHFPRFAIVQWINVQDETPDGTANTTGQAQGESNVTGVGRMTVRGTGIALATSQASGIRIGSLSNGAATGVSTAQGVGRKIARGTGTAAATSSASSSGNVGTISTGTGAAVATSTAFGIGGGAESAGNIVADGTLLSLSVDGVAWGPSGGGTTIVTGVGTAAATSSAAGIAASGAAETWSPTAKNSNVILSNGNKTAASDGTPASTHFAGRGVTAITAGQKRYGEFTVTNSGTFASNDSGVGICNASQTFADNSFLGSTPNGYGYFNGGDVYNNSSAIASIGNWSATTTICIAVDSGNKVWWRIGAGNWNNSPTDNPATGAGGINISALGDCFFAYNVRNAGALTANFGATAFAFTPPAGFSPI